MDMEKNIRIGFDAKRIVRNGTGLGSYSRTLVNALASETNDIDLLLYAPDEGRAELRQQVKECSRLRFVYPESRFFPFYKQWWRSRGIVGDLKRDAIVLFHGLSGELPIGLKKAKIPTLVTIHDLIFMRHPAYYHWWDVQIYIQKFKQTLQEADRIIAISERTKQDIVELGNYPADKIDVIYQSCSTRFRYVATATERQEVAAHYQLPLRYLLYVGTVEQRKNVLLAVKALSQLSEDIHLVILGRHTKYAQEVKTYIEQNHLTPRVHFLQGVPDAHLPAIYQQAEVFVYPSRYEGFGLPIIEAIQSGLPVVACTGSCLEEAGGPYSRYVDPDDVRGMTQAIESLMKGAANREYYIEKSKDYIQKFENKDTAQHLLKIYREMLTDTE